MPNTKSAMKALRVGLRKRAGNKAVVSAMKTQVRKARRAMASAKLDDAKSLTIEAVSAIDKAANKGVVHRRAAARRKSRLMRRLNQTLASAQD